MDSGRGRGSEEAGRWRRFHQGIWRLPLPREGGPRNMDTQRSNWV
jgi:hypothetical protein